jgi:hypothetical protein
MESVQAGIQCVSCFQVFETATLGSRSLAFTTLNNTVVYTGGTTGLLIVMIRHKVVITPENAFLSIAKQKVN